MDKSYLVFIAIGIGAIYFVTNFIGDIQKEDDIFRNDDYRVEHQYDEYSTVDSIGQEILDVTGADRETQLAAWNKSLLKEDFLMLFPSFDEMKVFIKERVRGEALTSKLLDTVNKAEDEFFSGTLSAEGAKRRLGSLK